VADVEFQEEGEDYQKSELNSLKRHIRDSQKRRRKSNRKEKDMSKRKLVMEENDGNVLLGVLQEGCDPIIKTKEGSIEEVLPAVPDFLKEAGEQWAVSPKNPTYKPPAKPKAATTPPATAEKPKQTEDLPLLAGTEKTTPAEETTGEAAAEVAEAPAAPAEAEAETEVPPAGAEAVEPAESGVEEGKSQQELSERIAQAPAPQPASPPPVPLLNLASGSTNWRTDAGPMSPFRPPWMRWGWTKILGRVITGGIASQQL